MRTAVVITVFVAAFAVPAAANAAGEFIEDIQVSRSGDTATVRFDLACPMRFRSDLATEAGALIEIRIAPLEACGADTLASEVYRPPSGRLAHVVEVEYEALGLGENLLVVRFDRPIQYRVAQRGDLRRLDLVVSVGDATAPAVSANATTPTVSSTIVSTMAGTSDAQSKLLTRGWWWTVQPHQVRFANGAKAGAASW